MTKQLQSDLSKLEKLKGIRIAITDDGQSFFLGFGYQRETPGEKTFAGVCWTAVATLYGACALGSYGGRRHDERDRENESMTDLSIRAFSSCVNHRPSGR